MCLVSCQPPNSYHEAELCPIHCPCAHLGYSTPRMFDKLQGKTVPLATVTQQEQQLGWQQQWSELGMPVCNESRPIQQQQTQSSSLLCSNAALCVQPVHPPIQHREPVACLDTEHGCTVMFSRSCPIWAVCSSTIVLQLGGLT